MKKLFNLDCANGQNYFAHQQGKATIQMFLKRGLFLILALMFIVVDGKSQYLDNLTDSWSKAPTAAYSTRKVISTYSGAAMTVRRNSDNEETDVNFDANGWVSLTSTVSAGGTLAAWVGSNSAFVTKWYDQSGNGNHATSAVCSGTLTCTKESASVTGTGAAFNVELGVGTKIYDATDGAYVTTANSAILANAFTASGNPTRALTNGKVFTRESQPRIVNAGVIDAMPNGTPALYLNESQSGIYTSGLTTPMTLSADANVNLFAVVRRTQINTANNVAVILANWTGYNTPDPGRFTAGYSSNVQMAMRASLCPVLNTTAAAAANNPYAVRYYTHGKKTPTSSENAGVVQLSVGDVTTSSAANGAITFNNSTKLNLFRPVTFSPRALMGYCPEVIYYANTTDNKEFNATDATALLSAQKSVFMQLPPVVIEVGASKTYTTIQAAYNSGIPATVANAYVIELQNDYEPASETFPIVFAAKTDASTLYSITIRPAVGVSKTFSSTSEIFKFNGAKYVGIDGQSGGTGGTKNIEISNSSTDATAATISFINSAVGNKVRYCKVLGSAVSTTLTPTTGTIVIGSTAETATGYGSTTIDNCDIADATGGLPTVGIYMVGTTGFTNEANNISNCNIYNYFNPAAVTSSGIYVGALAQSSNITTNKLYQTATRTYAEAGLHYPIYIGGSTSAITDNIIGYNDALANGNTIIDGEAAHRCVGIYVTKAVATLQGNTVSNIEYTSTSTGNANDGVLAGICYTGGNLPTAISSKPNTIKNLTLRFKSSTVLGIVGYSYNYFSGSANFANTIVNNLQAIPTGDNANTITGNVIGIYSVGPYGGSNKFNTVSNLSCGAAGSEAIHNVTGITANTGNNQPLTSERNLVYNLNAISTGASVITGINCSAGTGVATFKNNIVNLGNDVTSPAEIRGIYKMSVGKDVMYHNTIYIGGTTTGTTANSYSYFRNASTPAVVGEAVKNNIFVNNRIGGTVGMHYALKMLNAEDYSGGFIACTNNLLLVADDASAKLAFIGADVADFTTLTTSYPNFADGTKNADPMFIAPTDLTPDMHISSANSQANQTGVAIATVTDDYYGMLRADYTPVDMGAVVISGSTATINLKTSKLSVYAASNSIVIDNLMGSTATIYSLNGQMMKSVLLTSNKVAVPSAKGFYIVKVGAENTKVLVK